VCPMLTPAERLTKALLARFPESPRLREHYRDDLLLPYLGSGFAPPSLIEEIESVDEHKIWSFVWEAMLYGQLRGGYDLRPTSTALGQKGPDFCVVYNRKTIWIEATVPTPEGVPFGEVRVPFEQMLLRCTHAVYEKRKKIDKYRKAGIIGLNDCTVIAVNVSQLSGPFVHANGITQKPLMVEAVFPIGPLGVGVTPDGRFDGPVKHTARFTIPKGNNRIPTYAFLDESYRHVSAVVQGHQSHLCDCSLILSTIHNPRAAEGLPHGLFGRREEFVATRDGNDHYLLADIAA
jgi:hypothetical protein